MSYSSPSRDTVSACSPSPSPSPKDGSRTSAHGAGGANAPPALTQSHERSIASTHQPRRLPSPAKTDAPSRNAVASKSTHPARAGVTTASYDCAHPLLPTRLTCSRTGTRAPGPAGSVRATAKAPSRVMAVWSSHGPMAVAGRASASHSAASVVGSASAVGEVRGVEVMRSDSNGSRICSGSKSVLSGAVWGKRGASSSEECPSCGSFSSLTVCGSSTSTAISAHPEPVSFGRNQVRTLTSGSVATLRNLPLRASKGFRRERAASAPSLGAFLWCQSHPQDCLDELWCERKPNRWNVTCAYMTVSLWRHQNVPPPFKMCHS